MRQAQAVDERGKPWIVYENDSAWSPCQSLSKIGLDEVVLSRVTLLTGALPPPESIDIPDVPIDVVKMSVDVADIVKRAIRLRDCTTYLHNLKEVEE